MVSKFFSPLLHVIIISGQFGLACFCPSVESFAKFFCFESWHYSSSVLEDKRMSNSRNCITWRPMVIATKASCFVTNNASRPFAPCAYPTRL